MKIAIGSRIVKGPWWVVIYLQVVSKNIYKKNTLRSHNLVEKDIDIILLTEPESIHLLLQTYWNKPIKRFVNKNVKIVHRINECDERKGKIYNKKMTDISKSSDYTVFVSYWFLYKDFGLSI